MRVLTATLLLAACTSTPPKGPVTAACPMDPGDAGDLASPVAERCNVPGSMGAHHWYRLYASSDAMDIVQLELWDGRGAFEASGVVAPGTYPITGKDTDPATCGVCLRGMSDKGDAANQREFFATAGTVTVDAVAPDASAPFTATVAGVAFEEVNADKTPVDGGCTSMLTRAKMSGSMVIKGGTGGSGGGGGGGGGGGCPTTVGDP